MASTIPSDKILYKVRHFVDKNEERLSVIKFKEIELRYVRKNLSKELSTDCCFDSIDPVVLNTQSDRVSGIYEGGFKIWECTKDLIEYLMEIEIKRDITVLDLGCGVGLIGISLMKEKSPRSVDFQDLNEAVLLCSTLPNIIGNGVDSIPFSLVNGDWSVVNELLSCKGKKYDLIVSSETIYSVDNYKKIVDLLRSLLAPEGEAFFAAKSYYFGVGGGVDDFIQFVEKNSHFQIDIVKTIEENLERNILRIKFKK